MECLSNIDSIVVLGRLINCNDMRKTRMIIFLKTKFKSHEIQIQLHCKLKKMIFYILMQNQDIRTFSFIPSIEQYGTQINVFLQLTQVNV